MQGMRPNLQKLWRIFGVDFHDFLFFASFLRKKFKITLANIG